VLTHTIFQAVLADRTAASITWFGVTGHHRTFLACGKVLVKVLLAMTTRLKPLLVISIQFTVFTVQVEAQGVFAEDLVLSTVAQSRVKTRGTDIALAAGRAAPCISRNLL
jgi:hypothetical protein